MARARTLTRLSQVKPIHARSVVRFNCEIGLAKALKSLRMFSKVETQRPSGSSLTPQQRLRLRGVESFGSAAAG